MRQEQGAGDWKRCRRRGQEIGKVQENGAGDWKGAEEGGRRLERCRRREQEIGIDAWEEYKARY